MTAQKTDNKKDTTKIAARPSIVVNDMTLVAPRRNRKDIGNLKSAVVSAESITLPNRVELYDIYHDCVTMDGHLAGILAKRRDSICNKTLRYVNASGERVDALDPLINSSQFYRLVGIIVDTAYWGTSAVQFVAGSDFDFVEVPRKHIRPEAREITRYQYDAKGIPVDEIPGLWLLGQPRDLGSLLTCCLYSIYKRGAFGDFAQFVEIFGQPVRVARYDAYDTRTREELRKMCQEAGASLIMMLPKQADFEMLDGKTSNGNGDLQRNLILSCNEEMSVAILGNSETTTSSSSSGYAQAREHGKQQQEIIRSDMRRVEQCLNSQYFLSVLSLYGYPVEGGRFEFEAEADLAALTQRANIDAQIAAKVPIGDDYYYDTYGIPKPADYAARKADMEADRQAARRALQRAGQDGGDDDDNGKPSGQSKGRSKHLSALLDFFGVAPDDGA